MIHAALPAGWFFMMILFGSSEIPVGSTKPWYCEDKMLRWRSEDNLRLLTQMRRKPPSSSGRREAFGTRQDHATALGRLKKWPLGGLDVVLNGVYRSTGGLQVKRLEIQHVFQKAARALRLGDGRPQLCSVTCATVGTSLQGCRANGAC